MEGSRLRRAVQLQTACARMNRFKFLASIAGNEDGMFIAECPSVPGCVSQGATEGEAEFNIRNAIGECLSFWKSVKWRLRCKRHAFRCFHRGDLRAGRPRLRTLTG